MSEQDHRRTLRRNAERLISLRSVDAFTFLQTQFERKRERMVESLISRLLAGENMESMQRQIDYDRGFIDGMNYPERVLAGAEKTLLAPESEPDDEEVEDGWAM